MRLFLPPRRARVPPVHGRRRARALNAAEGGPCMQAAWWAALSEVSHGISLGLVLAAGSRCPDCSPSLVCPEIHCPGCACSAPALLPACLPGRLLSLSRTWLRPGSAALWSALSWSSACRVPAGPLRLADAASAKVLSVRPRRGVWGASEGSPILSDSGPRRAAAGAA